jgi:4,5-dihydroxyphthalate decarboxylase
MPTQLTLGLARTPRTQALFDGTVGPDNIRLECRASFSTGYDNTGARHRLILDGSIPGGEMSTSSYILARARGASIRALPIFLNRTFRHRCMYCSTESVLQHPKDLSGKVVTAHRYNSTTAVWVRGLLENEYGVKPEDMTWEIVEKDLGKEAEVAKPKGVRIGLIPEPRTREHAIRRVESGQIDAALEPYSDLGRNRRLRRILQDHRKEEKAYFKRTGVIPVIHTLVLQEEVVEKNPGIVRGLMAAFRKARKMEDANASPNERKESRWMRGFVEHDPYSYRLDPCACRSIETLIEYQMQQGLLYFKPNLDDLFFPNSIEDRD